MTLTMVEVSQEVQEIQESNCHPMTKITAKCWEYHSQSRLNNGNPPFTFSNYENALDKSSYLSHIEFGLIDYSTIGSKEEVVRIIENWF